MKKIYAGLFLLLAILVIVVVAIKTLEPQMVSYENYVESELGLETLKLPKDISLNSNISSTSNSLHLFQSGLNSERGRGVWNFSLSDDLSVEIPNWMLQHWQMFTSNGRDWQITPKEDYDHNDITTILLSTRISDEEFNARVGYEYDQKSQSDLILSQVILAEDDTTRIYHIQFNEGNFISDVFYVDGTLETVKVQFSASKINHQLYLPKIMEFMQYVTKGIVIEG